MKQRSLEEEKTMLDEALKAFMEDCRSRLQKMAEVGKSGWDDPMQADAIAIDLMDDAEAAFMNRDRLHLHDIANRAMMLWWQTWKEEA